MKGAKNCIESDICMKILVIRQMSHTCQQYKLIFGPKNPLSLVFAGQYFLSLFSDHPVSKWGKAMFQETAKVA